MDIGKYNFFKGRQSIRTREALIYFQPPRFTETDRDALTDLYEGMIIFNTTASKLNVYTGSAWEVITST